MVESLIMKVDIFGSKVSDRINIAGETTFKTVYGGICSIIVVMGLLLYVEIKLNILLNL